MKNSTYVLPILRATLRRTSETSSPDLSTTKMMDPSKTASVLERKIAHANKITLINEKHTTPTTIKFYRKKGEVSNEITKKHRALFTALLQLDENAVFLDQNDNECETAEDIPDGIEYDKKFIIDTDNRRGITYVQCKIRSKFTVYDLKNGKINLLSFLQDNGIYLQYRKFKTMKEATIGFLRDIHPDATLKTDLREDLNLLLKSVPLKPDELTTLMKNTPVDDDGMEDGMEEDNNEIVIPAYDIVNNKFGYGNAKDRVSTRVIEIRCDPDNAQILKKLLTRISLSSTNAISFMPTGMLQLSGTEIFKRSISAHNAYLDNFATFPVYEIYPEDMSLIRDQLLSSPYINRILKTKSSTTTGRWLIETTTRKMTQAQKHCEHTLTNMHQTSDQQHLPSMLNPELVDDDMLLLSQQLEKKYKDISPSTYTTHQHAPTTRGPVLASYNLQPSQQTKSYREATIPTQQSVTQEKDIIEPTYTPIDWESKMEEIRISTINECIQQTTNMIEASEKKQNEQMNKI